MIPSPQRSVSQLRDCITAYSDGSTTGGLIQRFNACLYDFHRHRDPDHLEIALCRRGSPHR